MARLSERIYDDIKKDILSCKLLPGQVITQAELSEAYSASRTPTREAMHALMAEGLIQTIPHSGYVVSPITLSDVYELFEVRALLEGDAASLAAIRHTPEDIERLSELARIGSVHHEQQNFDNFVVANRQFHMALGESSHNSRLVSMLEQVMNDLNRILLLGLDIRDDTHRSHNEHFGIIKAIKDGDSALAESITVRHSQISTQEVIEELLTKWNGNKHGQSAQVIRLDHRPLRAGVSLHRNRVIARSGT